MQKKETKKIYRAKLDDNRSRVIGWPKSCHEKPKKGFWQTIRSLLF